MNRRRISNWKFFNKAFIKDNIYKNIFEVENNFICYYKFQLLK